MRRLGGLEIRNLTGVDYGFAVEEAVALLLADVPASDLAGLYQVALLESRKGRVTDRTRWVGVYSNRDGRHALIELYLEPILGAGRRSRLDRWSGYCLSRVRLAQALFHQIGLHRQRMSGRSWPWGPELYSHYLLLRAFNPAKLLLHFPRRILRGWLKELRRPGEPAPTPTRRGGGRGTGTGG
jgi:hypothetical protein